MTNYDNAPDAAEADLRRASDALNNLENDLAIAQERADEAEREVDAAETPEDEAEAMQRLAEIEREIDALRQDVSSAEEHMRSTIEYWEDSR